MEEASNKLQLEMESDKEKMKQMADESEKMRKVIEESDKFADELQKQNTQLKMQVGKVMCLFIMKQTFTGSISLCSASDNSVCLERYLRKIVAGNQKFSMFGFLSLHFKCEY